MTSNTRIPDEDIAINALMAKFSYFEQNGGRFSPPDFGAPFSEGRYYTFSESFKGAEKLPDWPQFSAITSGWTLASNINENDFQALSIRSGSSNKVIIAIAGSSNVIVGDDSGTGGRTDWLVNVRIPSGRAVLDPSFDPSQPPPQPSTIMYPNPGGGYAAAIAEYRVQKFLHTLKTYVEGVIAANPGAEFYCTGHSLGGYLCKLSMDMFPNQIKGVAAFNSPNVADQPGTPNNPSIIDFRIYNRLSPYSTEAIQNVGVSKGIVVYLDVQSFGIEPSSFPFFGDHDVHLSTNALIRAVSQMDGTPLPNTSARANIVSIISRFTQNFAGEQGRVVVLRERDGDVRIEFPEATVDGVQQSAYSLTLPTSGPPYLGPSMPVRLIQKLQNGKAVYYELDYGNAPPPYYATGGRLGNLPIDPATGRPVGAASGATTDQLLDMMYGVVYPDRDPATASLPPPVPSAEQLKEIVVTRTKLVFPGLSNSQVDAINDLRKGPLREFFGPQLEAALVAGDKWLSFERLISGDLPPSFGVSANEAEQAVFRRDFQLARLELAKKFSPFSGEGGVPASKAEALSVLGRYDDAYITALGTKLLAMGLSPGDLAAQLNAYFPIDTILADPVLRLDVEVIAKLGDVGKRFERIFTGLTGIIFWIPQLHSASTVTLPYTPDGDLVIPLTSNFQYDPNRMLTLRYTHAVVGPVPEGAKWWVIYDDVTEYFDTQAKAEEYISSGGYRRRSDGSMRPPAEAIRADGEPLPAPGSEPGGGAVGGDDGEDLPAGAQLYYALTIVATRIASQTFDVRDPVAAILVNAAVEQAVKKVMDGTLQALKLLDELDSPYKAELVEGLKNSITAGLTALVVNQVMRRLLGVLGVDGVPGQLLTAVVSDTASTYVLRLLEFRPGEATLASSFTDALKSSAGTVVGNVLVSKIAPGNAPVQTVSSLTGSILVAIGAGGPYGAVAALAMVVTAIVLKAFGVGPSSAGPIGKVNLAVEAGQFKALPPYIKRNGFKGPAEQLTMTISSQVDIAVQTLNMALKAVKATVRRIRGTTGLRYYLKNDLFLGMVNGGSDPFDSSHVQELLVNFVEKTLRFTQIDVPADTDPVLVWALRLGWYDWLIRSGNPDYLASLPERESLFTACSAIMDAREASLASQSQDANTVIGLRLPILPEPEIIRRLLLDLRAVAQDIRNFITNWLLHYSYEYSDSGQVTYPFNALEFALDRLRAAAAELGMVVPALPEEVEPQSNPDNGLTEQQRVERSGNKIDAWLLLTASPPALPAQIPVTPPIVMSVEPVGAFDESASGTPRIRVRYRPLRPGETLEVQWRLRLSGRSSSAWTSKDFPPLSGSGDLTPVQSGKGYDVRVRRLKTVNGSPQQSEWTALQTVIIPTGLEGAQAARMELSRQSTDTVWKGRDVQINWSGQFPAIGNATNFTSVAPPTDAMLGYGIRILTSSGRLLREVGPVLETGYTYRYEDNLADSRTKGLPSASRALRFEVSILPKVGPAVGMQALTVTNDAPPKVGVVANAGVGLLSVEVTPVADLDLDGYAIWISDQPGFDPASMAPTYRGPSPQVVQRNLVLGNWYIRAAAVDLFQPREGLDVAGLNLSDEVMVNLADITVDKVPPAVPTGLTLTSDISFTSGREQVVTLTATWDRNLEADFLVYEGQIRRGDDGDWNDFSLGLPATGAPSHVWRVEAGTQYTVRLRGRDRSGNVSDYGAAVSIISAVDTTPPGPLSDVAADVGLRSVILRWSNPPDLDLDMVEVFRAAANDRAQALRIGSVRGSVFADQGLSPGSTWHYWLRAVDRTGNTGDWSHGDTAGLAVAIPRATADDIADAQLNFAKFAQGIEPVGMVDSLPTPAGYTGPRTVMLTGDGKLYRLVADAWTAAVAAGDVAGQLAAHQIAADAIIAGKIAAGAVNAREIAAGAINAERIAAGAILANHITANAVRAEHIQAGAVTADRIAVANLAAVSANLGTITAGSLGVDVAYAGQIEAGQIKAGTVLSDSVIVGGTALSAIRANASLGASDPAARINSGTTTISGGKITTGSIDTTQITVFSSQYRIGNLKFRASRRTTPDNLNNLVIEWGALSNGTFSDGHIQMADANGLFVNTPIRKGLAYGTVGTPMYVYWNQTDLLYLTPQFGEVSAGAILLATFRDIYDDATGSSSLNGPLPTALKVVGNDVRAGQVSSRIVSAGELVADEIRIGPAATGYPGIYLRKSESTTYAQTQPNGTVLNIPVEQRTLFCYDGIRRRAQIFQHQYDSGFEAWDAAGTQIFGSNGFGTGSVDARVIRPESATFVRTCRGAWSVGSPKAIRVITIIQGLPAAEKATIVLTAFSNGHDSARTSPTVNPPNPDTYRMRVVMETLDASNNVTSSNVMGGVWLNGNFLMNYQDSVQVSNGRYAFYVKYDRVADQPGNPDLTPTTAYLPYTSLTAFVSMR